eukprot:TRINITY_DN1639_c9_g1_i1.p1 TRINITY_DN1639_c9_g1~~TRINITY_DN1639_c9_g1_i1.p1  ORF type:complete len:409 (+),score=96.22 TRINITY_DN1639_c9_g1_i1:61-1227(+)
MQVPPNAELTYRLLQSLRYMDATAAYNHCYQMILAYPHLKPSAATNSNQEPTLRYDGTVKITYMGAEYNIPLVIWVPNGFPSRAGPIIYVAQQQDMKIAPNHPVVNSTGLCRSQWEGIRNLSETVHYLVREFSKKPPLHSHAPRPAGGYQAPGASTVPVPGINPYAQQQQMQPQQQQQSAPYPYQQVQQQSIQRSPPPKEVDPVEEVAAHLRQKLKSDLDTQCKDLHNTTKETTEANSQRLSELSVKLSESEQQLASLNTDITRLNSEKEMLTNIVKENEEWLKKHSAEEPVDQMPEDHLSCQALELASEDMALDDMLRILHEMLSKKCISGDDFVKTVRQIGSRQFTCRATHNKVKQKMSERERAREQEALQQQQAQGSSQPIPVAS